MYLSGLMVPFQMCIGTHWIGTNTPPYHQDMQAFELSTKNKLNCPSSVQSREFCAHVFQKRLSTFTLKIRICRKKNVAFLNLNLYTASSLYDVHRQGIPDMIMSLSSDFYHRIITVLNAVPLKGLKITSTQYRLCTLALVHRDSSKFL